jgi:putative holliday junction resolvase
VTTRDSSPKRVLGVDLGLKKTGLAVSDPLGISTRALDNLTPKSRAEDVAYLDRLCRDMEVEAVVVGLPLMSQSKSEGMMARRARGFAEALQVFFQENGIEIEVFLLDETGTSREAVQRLVQTGMPKKRRRSSIDGEAARILAETFLDGNQGESMKR